MFEKLFVKTSDLVFHKIAPFAVERERFLEYCCEEGFSKVALSRIAGIVVTAACDLHAHGGLDVDQERLEAAAGRIEMTRRQAGVRDDAREYRMVLSDFMLTGGDGLGLGDAARVVEPLNVQDLDALIAHVRSMPGGVITADATPRLNYPRP